MGSVDESERVSSRCVAAKRRAGRDGEFEIAILGKGRDERDRAGELCLILAGGEQIAVTGVKDEDRLFRWRWWDVPELEHVVKEHECCGWPFEPAKSEE